MSFQNGNVAFRRMHIAGNMGPDVADQLAKRGMDLTTPKTAFGWASWQSTLIPLADGRDAICAGYVRANLVRCKPAVQARYRRERIKAAMLHAAADAGVQVKMLSKRDRIEIRNAVDEELFKASTPAIRAIEFALRPGDNWLLASCMSLAEQDFLVNFFREAAGGSLHAVTIPVWASVKGVQLPDFPEWDFVNDGPADDGGSMADDFLTWLWAREEAEGCRLKAVGNAGKEGKAQPVTCALDGPITLHGCDGDKGPRTVMLRAGTPTLGDELLAALRAGKKIASAKLMIEAQGKAFHGMVDASLGFRSVKLPPSTAATDADAFQERMVDMRIWTETVYSLVEAFAETRMDPGAWGDFTSEVQRMLWGKAGVRSAGRGSGIVGREQRAESEERKADGGMIGSARVAEIVVDMDVTCSTCGRPGATKNGMCLPCATKAIRGKSVLDPGVEELVGKATDIIKETRRASTSSIQRRLRIGYTLAAHVMDLLEERGVVGPVNADHQREVLVA